MTFQFGHKNVYLKSKIYCTLFEIRPEGERPCVGAEPCQGVWFAGSPGDCSVTCGGGKNRRKVFCVEEGEPVAPDRCDVNERPMEEGDCNENVSFWPVKEVM